ncbi:hypothetical protein [Bradyrhizobium canariense]|uniref:Sel1 repeat-containing protein n=1 Tax=Bradyrhizobium canariense TaxID=255045 RepID=A0A1H1N9D1_9BRAD|nr:hypothetical protein [Bradyrhizobium canariense]SDR95528.1 hypothetical protein SAMN05444158_0533 [Bradyrhizobium canariense]
MSTLDPPEDLDPNNPQYYAPRWLRARPDDFPATQPLSEEEERARRADFGSWRRVHDAAELERAVAEALRRPQEPVSAHEFLPAYEAEVFPRERTGKPAVFGVAARFTAAICVAAGVASFFVIMVPASRDLARPADGGGASYLSAFLQSVKTTVSPISQRQMTPAIVARDDASAISEPAPPSANVTAPTPTPSAAVVPSVVPASPPLTTAVVPDAAAKVQTAMAELPTASTAAPQNPVRQLPPAEIAALIKRGEELATNGDFAAARLLFQRAAEAHDARAAFALAATFDPIVINQVGANPSLQDVARARTWYQRASDWGSAEAPKELEALVSTGR